MKVIFSCVLLFLQFSIACSQNSVSIKDVTVVDVEKGILLKHQTVNIKNGVIVEIGSSSKIKANENIIVDGKDKYLAPGYYDMHVHTFDKDEFPMFLINGVTTVRNLHGVKAHLNWRDSIQQNLLAGPNLYTSGPILDGNPPTRRTNKVMYTRKQVRDTIAYQKKIGYDFIKLYDNVPDSIYQEILKTAAENLLPVIGHVPTPIGIEKLIAYDGQGCIEHIEELVPFFPNRTDTMYMSKIAKALKAKNIWIDPTLLVFTWPIRERELLPEMLARPGMQFMNKETLQMWNWKTKLEQSEAVPERMKERTEFATRVLFPFFFKAGVNMMIGTDSPMPTILPGYSFHEEIAEWASAGISPIDILRACTIKPATYLKINNKAGSVAIGKVADLVLLKADPLVDSKNLSAIEIVIKRGNVHPVESLMKSLKK